MRLRVAVVLLLSIVTAFAAGTWGVARRREITVYRDDWGVPASLCQTIAGAAFAAGYRRPRTGSSNCCKTIGSRRARWPKSPARERVSVRLSLARLAARADWPRALQRARSAAASEFAQPLSPGCSNIWTSIPCRSRPVGAKARTPFSVMLSRFIIWGWPEGQAAGRSRTSRHQTLSGRVSWFERMADRC